MNSVLSQIGVQAWRLNPDFKSNLHTSNADFSELVPEPNSSDDCSELESVELTDTQRFKNTVYQGVVVIGSGLEEVWQNEASEAWLLWQNITQAFGWEGEPWFVDTHQWYSEEAAMVSLQELEQEGVKQVIVLGDQESLDYLYEFADVILLPDFDELLNDPFSKKYFFQTCLESVQ
jgi:hypothetical protein